MVVLPAPFGPSSATRSPAPTVRSTPSTARTSSKAFTQAVGFEHVPHRSAVWPTGRGAADCPTSFGALQGLALAVAQLFRRGARRQSRHRPDIRHRRLEQPPSRGRSLRPAGTVPFDTLRYARRMSVDSTALERSALERKDRDELLTIAKALGGKPPARAKKADIVDLVLELTGRRGRRRRHRRAEPPPTATRSRRPPRPPTAPPRPLRPRPTRERRRAAEEPPAEWEVEPPADERRPSAEADADGRRAAEARRPAGRRRATDRNGQRQPGNGQGNGGGNGGNGGPGQPAAEQAERRPARRRRGRQPPPPPPRPQPRSRGRPRPGPGRGSPRSSPASPIDVEGYLDLRDEGYGFLRVKGYLPSQGRRLRLGEAGPPVRPAQGRPPQGRQPPGARATRRTRRCCASTWSTATTPSRPASAPPLRGPHAAVPRRASSRSRCPSDPTNMTARIIDLISPIGKGQRGLIVSPPKAGKTTIMKQIARSIEVNNPEVHLIVLLVDERPEEVTDMKRWLHASGEVVASTFDRPVRGAHPGRRAHHRAGQAPGRGRARTSSSSSTASPACPGPTTWPPRPPAASCPAASTPARCTRRRSSSARPATSRRAARSRSSPPRWSRPAAAMDEVIFEEFKGTGNMELRLDRAPRRAPDLPGHRRRRLVDPPRGAPVRAARQLQQVWKLRRVLSGLAADGGSGGAGLELLIDRMKTFKTNDEFLAEIGQGPG